MGNLGAVLIQMGEFTEAENYIRREYELSKVMYGNDSVDIYPIEQNLAEIQIQLGNIDSAAALLENVVQGYKRQLGDRHPDTLAAISSFALIKMRHQGQMSEASSLLIEAVDGQSATLGEFHPQTFDSLQLLAQGYLMVGDPVGFGPVATRAHAAAIEIFGESADTTLAWLQARALVARDSGQFGESERILGELEMICAEAETLGATGQQVCDTVPTLFVSLYDQWHEAEPQSNHDLSAVRWREQIKGDDAPVN
jgi:tetratricopeptide (TPR) repeat protein